MDAVCGGLVAKGDQVCIAEAFTCRYAHKKKVPALNQGWYIRSLNAIGAIFSEHFLTDKDFLGSPILKKSVRSLLPVSTWVNLFSAVREGTFKTDSSVGKEANADAEMLVEEAPLRDARVALCQAVRQVVANGLDLLGVSAPETM